MTDESSRRGDRPAGLDDEREIAGFSVSWSHLRREVASGERRRIDAYDEGLDRYFELSSSLASRRVHGEDGTEEHAELRAEAAELDRQLSSAARGLSLAEIGALLQESPDD